MKNARPLALALSLALILSSLPPTASHAAGMAARGPAPRLSAGAVIRGVGLSATVGLSPLAAPSLKTAPPSAPSLSAPAAPAASPIVPSALPSAPVSAPKADAPTAFAGLQVPMADFGGMGPGDSREAAAADFAARIGQADAAALSGAGFVPATRKVTDLRQLLEKDRAAGLSAAEAMLFDEAETRIEVKLAAFRVLQQQDAPRAVTAALKVLEAPILHSGTQVKVSAALKGGVPASADARWYLRREAARLLGSQAGALSGAGRDAAVAQLKAHWAHPNPSTRLMAGAALKAFGIDPGPEPEAAVSAPRQVPVVSAAPRMGIPPSPKPHPFRHFLIIGGLLLALWGGMTLLTPKHSPAPAPKAQVEQVVPAPQAPQLPSVTVPSKSDSARELAGLREELKRAADASERTAKAVEELKPKEKSAWSGVLNMLLMIGLPILIIVWLMRRMSAGGGGGAGGGAGVQQMTRAKVNAEKPSTRFTDVAGVDETLVEIQEIMQFLKDPGRFRRMGARIPKGVLLEGPPGTGKTLAARALAGETNASFFSISASDFVELFVGMGAARVRSLFEQAKANAPAIIFIDEIDAVGKARGGGNISGSNDEREQTINALLSAMDGFDNSGGIIVIAATNRAEMLDPALVRPGRFDRKIHVGLPEVMGREAILQLHAKRARLDPSVDLQFVAQRSAGLSGAYLEGIVNESALLAARRGADAVGKDDVDEAIDRQTIGQKRSLYLSPELKRRIAYHESGHVLANLLGRHPSPVNKVTIIPHGSGALGFAESGAEEGDKYLYTREELEARMDMAMGGLVAEKLLFGTWSTGPGSDLEMATRVARTMVERLGMSDKVGKGVSATPEGSFGPRKVSERTARDIDEEVKRLLDESEARATEILTRHRDKLDALSAALLQKETLQRDEILAIAGK